MNPRTIFDEIKGNKANNQNNKETLTNKINKLGYDAEKKMRM